MFQDVQFRCSVCECFNGILHKGMEATTKTQLIESFVNVDTIKSKLTSMINGAEPSRDEEFMIKMSKLVNTIGLELIDSYKKLKPKQTAQSGLNGSDATFLAPSSLQSGLNGSDATFLAPQSGLNGSDATFLVPVIESKLGLLCHFLNDSNPRVSLQVHPFAREYIQWIKNQKSRKDESSLTEIITIFSKIIITRSKYPLDYDFESFMSSEEDVCDSSDYFMECRKSTRILFENLMLLDSNLTMNVMVTNLIQPVFNGWKNGASGGIDYRDVEISLYMFYLLGENMNIIQDSKKIESLVHSLISSSVSSFNHPLVQLMYFELIIRYEKFFSSTLSILLPQILVSFMDERGFKSSNRSLRSRVSRIFNKFIKMSVKGKGFEKIQGFTEDIMKRLSPLVKPDAVDDEDFGFRVSGKKPLGGNVALFDLKYHISADDQLLLHETMACLIISNTNYDQTKKYMLLKSFLIEESWKYFDELYITLADMNTRSNGNPLMNGNSSTCDRSVEVNCLCRKISHVISLVAWTSKAFSNVHPIKSINCQSLYLDSFNTFIKVLSLDGVGEENLLLLQSSLRLLLHRLIVCLEESEIVPLIPVAVERIFLPSCNNSNMSGKIVQELMPLINQIVTKFKHSWMFHRDLLPFLKQMFLPLVSSIFNLTSKDTPAAPVTNAESTTELTCDEIQSLHKCYYTFLSVLASNNVIDVFVTLRTFSTQTLVSVFYFSMFLRCFIFHSPMFYFPFSDVSLSILPLFRDKYSGTNHGYTCARSC